MGAQAQPAQLDADTLVRRRLITFSAAGLSVFSLYFLVRRLAEDAMVVRALQRVLDPSTVFTAEGGEALEHLAHDRFDAILCDVMMPGMSGPEFFARVRSEHPAMVPRMVFMTGGAFTDEARAFLDQLSNRCLPKPIQPDQLRATLSTLGRRA